MNAIFLQDKQNINILKMKIVYTCYSKYVKFTDLLMNNSYRWTFCKKNH
jgi:hypothetical protein